MDGDWCLCRKALREAAGLVFFASLISAALDFEIRKKSVIGFCRNGVMPSMFQEKIRKVFESRGERGVGVVGVFEDAVCTEAVTALRAVLHRLAGGGLIP